MGILDDAIREHLDLKRKHGARDSEISEIEDEALGSGDRPDPFAAGELFGQVSSPGASTPEAPAQESGPATPPPDSVGEPPAGEEPTALVDLPAEAPPESPQAQPPEPSFPEPPPAGPPEPSFPEPAEPAAPEPPSPGAAAPESPSAPEPPAESESLEELMAEEEEEEASPLPGGADTAVPPPPPPESEAAARPEPPSPPPPAATEGQRGRALGRADVPTQEHIPPREGTGDVPAPGEPGLSASEPEPPPSEPELPPSDHEPPASEPPPLSIEAEARDQDGPQLYDFETDPGLLEDPNADLEPAPPPAEESDDFEALGPVDEGEETGEDLYPDEPYGEQRGGTTDFEETEAVEGDHETEVRRPAPADDEDDGYGTEVRPVRPAEDEEEDDLLSESPEFLEEDTDESLWFEKGPPKDFDFEDEEK